MQRLSGLDAVSLDNKNKRQRLHVAAPGNRTVRYHGSLVASGVRGPGVPSYTAGARMQMFMPTLGEIHGRGTA